MREKLKTVPLRELFGDTRRQPATLRIGIIAFAVMEACVLAIFVWRVIF